MARKRVTEAPALKSWEEVNDALREIAEAQIALGDIESEMQKQMVGIKKIAEQDSKPYNDRIAKLERDLKEFVSEHRADLGDRKNKLLNFGEVGFRLSTSVSLPKAKEKLAEIIRRLKARSMMDCVVVEEKVSRENLKKYGEDTVNAVGATWKQKDEFGYEVFVEKLERLNATMDI
ncbi:MAG: host-nuclease inhibitor Gam family protein [Oscillospiraceae bacterium]|nr:host-nuclease inhibitor Gam family protein [Oscillospiraceae bacterium]